MACKIVCNNVFPSLVKILNACRELSQVAKFSTTQKGFLIEAMDTFYHTQLSCEIKANERGNKNTNITTFINIETSLDFIAILKERKSGPILITFDENTNICIKNPNIDIDLVSPLVYMSDFDKKYMQNDISNECFLISYIVADITTTFLQLCVGSGVAHISLNTNGNLIYEGFCESGLIHISKQLKKNNANEYGYIKLKVIIKFVKSLIAVAASTATDAAKKCTLELPKKEGYVKIHFNLCPEASGYFALTPY